MRDRVLAKQWTRWFAVLVAALAGACAAGGPAVRGEARFGVHFNEARCPDAANVPEAQRNCEGKPHDCVKVVRGTAVVFEAEPAERARPFAVYFQPFEPLQVRDGKATFKVDAQAPEKAYVFSVVAEGCPVLDPKLIISP